MAIGSSSEDVGGGDSEDGTLDAAAVTNRNPPAAAAAPAIGTSWNGITYLGEGPDAVVRLGCVLVAPDHENSHFLRRAAVLVHAMGEIDPAAAASPSPFHSRNCGEGGGGSGEYMIRGLILDHPTAFTLADMMPGVDPETNRMSHLPIFRGGDTGRDGLILLQHIPGPRAAAAATSAIEISKNGLYHGGWDEALRAASGSDRSSAAQVHAGNFKVFFNYLEFTETQLEEMLAADPAAEGGDDCRWVSLEVPPSTVLNSDYSRGGAWSDLRNAVARMRSEARS
jgi:hypothetical protein